MITRIHANGIRAGDSKFKLTKLQRDIFWPIMFIRGPRFYSCVYILNIKQNFEI